MSSDTSDKAAAVLKTPVVKFEKAVAAIFFLILLGSVFLQVVTRFEARLAELLYTKMNINLPIINVPWTSELANFCFIWLLMFGAAVGVAMQQHFALTLLTNKIPQKFHTQLELAVLVVELVFVVLLSVYGIKKCFLEIGQVSPGLKISYAFFYASIPTGAAFMCYHVVKNIIGRLKGQKNSPEDQ